MSDEFIEIRPCPVCSSVDHQEIFIKNGGRYVSCKECTMVFLNPVFKDEKLVEYYINNNTHQALAHDEDSEFYRNIYNSGLDLIGKHKDHPSILDIGCSGGFFLDLARARGFLTYGIELNKQELEIARQKKHQVWSVPFAEIDRTLQFDVISMWDVFEHIKSGVEYLTSLRESLSSDGIVFIQIPSSDSLAARILQEKCNMFDGLEHVNLYNLKTINSVAKRAGFRVKFFRSVISELGPISNYLAYNHPYFGSFSFENQVGLLNEENIIGNNLGYKFQVALEAN